VFAKPRLIRLALLICAAAPALALSACGGSGSNATAAQDNEQRLVSFAKCMREHGVQVSTPTSGQLRITGRGTPANPRALDAAQNACKRYAPAAGREKLSPAERAARQDQLLKFARCMREHGVNVPDPETGGGRLSLKIQGINPSSPAFQAAQKACQGLMPKPPGGFTGAPGGPPGAGTSSGGSAKPGAGPQSGASLSLSTGG
jgi:hypothetical protein